MMIAIGNDESNNFWEWNSSEEEAIDPSVDMWVNGCSPSNTGSCTAPYSNLRTAQNTVYLIPW